MIYEDFSTETNKDTSYLIDVIDINLSGPGTWSLTSGQYTGLGQSFAAGGRTMNEVRLKLSKSLNPSGNFTVNIYTHSGTFGSTSVPNVLVASKSVAASSLTTAPKMTSIIFDTPVELTEQYYVVTIEYSGTGGSVVVSWSGTSVHSGNISSSNNLGAFAYTTGDLYFIIIEHIPAVTADWNTTLGRLQPTGTSPDIDLSSFAISTKLNTGTENIASIIINPVEDVPSGCFIQYEVSNDGGGVWEVAARNTVHTFSDVGADLRFKITLSSNGVFMPYVDSLTIDILPLEGENIINEKTYTFKVYENVDGEAPSGTDAMWYVNLKNLITTWPDASFEGFRKSKNGGLGECTIKLSRPFDDFGEGYDVKLNNRVDIVVNDFDTDDSGKVIYSGYISKYSPYIDGFNEGVEITLLGYVTKFSLNLIHSGAYVEAVSQATGIEFADKPYGTSLNAQACYIHTFLDDLIGIYGHYDTVQGTMVSHPVIETTPASIETNPNQITYRFNSKTYYEVIEFCRSASPADWYWFVGADNILQFKAKPLKATHTFTFGKDFKSIKVEKNMENVINHVLFSSSGNADREILQHYEDTASISLYDDRWELLTDSRVSDIDTADNIGTSALNEKKDANVKVTIEILDNNGTESGYDIESINPGDTCRFLNLNTNTSSTFTDNMIIESVEYTPDKVVLSLEDLDTSINKEINENSKKISQGEESGRPSSYEVDSDGWHEVGGTDEPAFQNSWVNYGSTLATCAYRKDNNGIVYLKGVIKSGVVGQYIFTLPVGYRPPKNEHFSMYSDNSSVEVVASIIVGSDGNVRANVGHNNLFSLSGASFKTV